MSEAIIVVVKFAFGFIRSYCVERLQDASLTDQIFRGLILNELDEIKIKLDGLSRKDLFASISDLKQGFERLIMSFGQPTESVDPSSSEFPRNKKQSEDTTMNLGASAFTQAELAKTSEVFDAVALVSAIANLKLVSNKRFQSAMESFKEAGKKANVAFHNAALSTEERILASKVRIASGILEHLDDPDFAARDCLQYLQELHDLSAIQDIFSVHIKAGVKSRIKSRFKKDSRIETVETVTMMNLILADFISKFTKKRMGVLDWPMIERGKRVVHPIHYEKDSLRNLKELEITLPWEMVKSAECYVKGKCAFNKNRDLICFVINEGVLKKLDKTTGKLQSYCVSVPQDRRADHVHGLAVDDEDTVCVLSSDDDCNYSLSAFSKNGVNTHHRTLEFLKGKNAREIGMCVTKDKNIVICYEDHVWHTTKVWLCDCNGELRDCFIDKNKIDTDSLKGVFATCNNEILVVTEKSTACDYVLRSYTKDGHLQRTVKFRPNGHDDHYSICYNEATKNIIGCTDFNDSLLVEFRSDETGEVLRSYLLKKTNLLVDLYCPHPSVKSCASLDKRHLPYDLLDMVIVCHVDGTLALVEKNHNVLFLNINI